MRMCPINYGKKTAYQVCNFSEGPTFTICLDKAQKVLLWVWPCKGQDNGLTWICEELQYLNDVQLRIQTPPK